MKDEVVEFPHRYRDKTTGQIIDLIREPGEIMEEGTPICRGTLLSNQTEKMLGMQDATPDMALQQLTVFALETMLSGAPEESAEESWGEIEVGTFKNAGSGWNTYTFKKTFAATPVVFAQLQQENYTANIKNVTPEKFLYMVSPSTSGAILMGYLAAGGDTK